MNIKTSTWSLTKKDKFKPKTSKTEPLENNILIECKNLNLFYDTNHALIDIDMKVKKNKVTAIIGPSGCGKSTLIRAFNRMNDVIDCCRVSGEVWYRGKNLYGSNVNVIDIRKKIGMIFQKPNPFPMSIYDNIAYGPRLHKVTDTKELDQIVEESLKRGVLWDEVNDRLKDSAIGLSGGQQQRLCIARALAIEPEVILMDEPTSALDPIATAKIEELILELKEKYTVIIVTHNMQQAARISDYTAFMYIGKLVEYGKTEQIFENPQEQLTENYITGRFG